MNDRALLEAAAKAAGYAFKWGTDWHDKGTPLVDGRDWYPLDDDGDALRLAVKLGMHCVDSFPVPTQALAAECGGDWYAATRRAIVKAAALKGDPRE